ncbi:carbohydrate binding domain-containing protein [Chloroflexota bacterium]
MHFRIKLPYKSRYVIISVLMCALIMGISVIALRAEAAPPYNSTRANAAIFMSEGMVYDLAEMGEIPLAFDEIRTWLEGRRQSEGFFRTVWLPGDRLLMLRLLHRYDSPTLKGSRENDLDHIMLTLLPIIRGGTEDAGKLLAHYNVKYVIVYLALDEFLPDRWQKYYTGSPHLVLQEPWGLAPGGEAEGYVKLLDRQRDLKLVVDKPEYRIYENLDFTIPHISAYNRIFLVAPPDLTRGLPLEVETPAMQRPVENWNYFYGYSRLQEKYPYQYLSGAPFHFDIEDFPLEYLHGQTLATIPGLLSKIPNLNASQHLLVFGEFLPSEETREEYLELADAVIFLGDVDSSEEAWKWTEEAEALLFVHEAESSLTFTPDELSEETTPLIIADDNQAAFWEGKGAIQLSNDSLQIVSSADSLKIAVDEGNEKRWHLEHNYTIPQDWSGKDFISLNWYGGNTGATLRLIALNSYDPLNYFCYYFIDDFSGWERIKILLGDFTTVGEPTWDNITLLQMSVMEDNISGTWYLERVIADVNPPTWIATVIGGAEEIDPTVIADDNQIEFWQGKGSLQLANETREKVNGAHSLKIAVDKGNVNRWHLEHDYTIPQDWSGKDFISLNWYGGNTGATLRLIALNSYEPLDYFGYYFTDDFGGWQRIKAPLGHFVAIGEPSWDNITFLQISVMEENISGTWYLDRIIADVNPPEAAIPWNYEHALLVPQDGELVKPFFAPGANYFRVMIRAAVDGEISLKINDELLNITDIYEGEDGINWYESGPIYLEAGDHILSIDFKGNEATFDQILILSTKREDTAFKDIFSTDQLEVDWVEKRPSEYSVRVNSDDPAFIVLGEAYHAEWQASVSDGENLKHIPAFPLGWANGFSLPEGGEQQVEIEFGMQRTKDIAIRVWMIAWGCVIAAILGIWILHYRRRLRR